MSENLNNSPILIVYKITKKFFIIRFESHCFICISNFIKIESANYFLYTYKEDIQYKNQSISLKIQIV